MNRLVYAHGLIKRVEPYSFLCPSCGRAKALPSKICGLCYYKDTSLDKVRLCSIDYVLFNLTGLRDLLSERDLNDDEILEIAESIHQIYDWFPVNSVVRLIKITIKNGGQPPKMFKT